MKKMFIETNGFNAVAFAEENGTKAFVMIDSRAERWKPFGNVQIYEHSTSNISGLGAGDRTPSPYIIEMIGFALISQCEKEEK